MARLRPAVIVHYHELSPKRGHRPLFLRQLARNLERAVSDLGPVRLRQLTGRILLDLDGTEHPEAVRDRAARVCGVASVALAWRVASTIEAMKAAVAQIVDGRRFPSFRISARRAFKTYPMTSVELNRELGAFVLERIGHDATRVDLHHADLDVHLEVLPAETFVYVQPTPGPGGLPVGASGTVAALLSGGIDSPVAAWRMMKRGCRVLFVHFHSVPYLPATSQAKARALVERLTEWQYRSQLMLVPLGEIQREVVLTVPPPLRVVVYRRMMVRIAQVLARQSGVLALATGESVGQVASQTLHNIARVLLECGLFQGAKSLQERNWTPPVQASTLQAVLLSHAHIDHSGYLPRLVRDGFDGSIFCSPATADLIGIMLPDAARLSEEEAEFRNRTGATRHQPALPLFTEPDATRALGLVRRVASGDAFTPAPGVTARLSMSGHILGASVVQVTTAGRRLVYSGDLGRYGVAVMRDPDPVSEADTLVIESTYGNRLHPSDDGRPILVEAVQRAVSRRGILLVPAFAVGRTQELLFLIAELETAGQIPRLDVYLDSPMAAAANAIYARYPDEQDPRAAGRVPSRFHLAPTPGDSKRLNELDGPAIILAGSGMATGGRVLHHLRRRLGDERTTVLLAGYQAAGTRGRLLRDGATTLRTFGEEIPVRAKLLATDALSAHADQREILRWLRQLARPPQATWAVHGEPDAAAALRDAIARDLGWRVAVAADGQRVAV